jgi:ribosome-associated translation inhibitor RaiA
MIHHNLKEGFIMDKIINTNDKQEEILEYFEMFLNNLEKQIDKNMEVLENLPYGIANIVKRKIKNIDKEINRCIFYSEHYIELIEEFSEEFNYKKILEISEAFQQQIDLFNKYLDYIDKIYLKLKEEKKQKEVELEVIQIKSGE